MSNEDKPPASVTTDLRVAHLIKAVTRKGEIRFELHVPENDSAPALAEDLRGGFYIGGMPYVSAREGPISVHEDGQDKSRIAAVYRPHGKRDPDKDMRAMVRVFSEMEIPITDKVKKGIQNAFDALKELDTPRHRSAVASELARRQVRKGPGRGRGEP
jgi:hypothetical protein